MKAPVQKGDFHIVVSHAKRTGKCFDSAGKMLWIQPVLTEGVADDVDLPGGDTPLGLYRCTEVVESTQADTAADWRAYGPWFIGLYDMEGQESGRGRAGIGMHGGGSALADPQADDQPLVMTHGCLRWKNGFLKKNLVPLIKGALHAGHQVFVTVVS